MDNHKKSNPDNIEQMAKEFAISFSNFTEIEGVIIRGHILLEQTLNKSIEHSILLPEEYKPEKFSFTQKLCIASMLGISPSLKLELNALNKLRNQIAHSLHYEEKYIDIIIESVKKRNPAAFKEKTNQCDRLKTAISFMCGYVYRGDIVARLAITNKVLRELKE